MTKLDMYPIVVLEDRYSGAYSGGLWIAVAEGDKRRRMDEVWAGAHGDDITAAEWAQNMPEWVAVGGSPNDAVRNLHNKLVLNATEEK